MAKKKLYAKDAIALVKHAQDQIQMNVLNAMIINTFNILITRAKPV